MTQPVRKAVFPVAGLGTRFLPATKASPKEMLPVVDKPLIQYAAEEAVAAGITDLIFVTGRTKRAIEDHFDRSVELETELGQRGKTQMLEMAARVLPAGVNCIYIRQAEPLGLGHAVLCARPAVGHEPFAVLLPDDLISNHGAGCTEQLVRAHRRTGRSILAVQQVAAEDTDKYGIVRSLDAGEALTRIDAIVEKPAPADAPSDLGVVGRYVLTASIFDHLERTERGAGGEIQLTDGIASLLGDEDVYAFAFEGTRYDCGSKHGFLEATVELALEHPEVGKRFAAFMRRRFGADA